MAMKFRYRLKDKIIFYAEYFVSKVFLIWFEVRRPKFKMFLYEVLYSAKKLINYASLLPSPFHEDLVVTKFGSFRIRPHTVDMSNVSPAFERRDIDYLLRLIQTLKVENRKILFGDIGADIGTFTVTVGNQFRDYEHLHIMTFEPAESSFALLEENIQMNNLKEKVESHKVALFSENNKEIEFQFNPAAPGSSSIRLSGSDLNRVKVRTKTLDALLIERIYDYDVIILKIDVEGVETEVLKGGEKVLHSGRDIYLLVEDFVNPDIINFLERRDATFICKLTPYNSWWHVR
jgi:FkbM family methyltransferase